MRSIGRRASGEGGWVHGVVAGALFLLALSLRLLFWQSTADASWAYSACYKGDAPVWLSYAAALLHGQPFELGLPLRPPGAAYLMAGLWDGTPSGIATLRLLWCVLGAAGVPLVYGAARRAFGLRIALLTGLLTAASTGLMVLATSLNNETPYLLLVAALLYLWRPLLLRPRGSVLAAAAVLHGLACLVRVEHALFFVLVSAYLAWAWARADIGGGWRRGLLRTGATGLVFALVLLPWQLKAWGAIDRFNTEPLPSGTAAEQALARVESLLSGMPWSPEALAERDRLPACCRRTAAAFVAATVAVRGGREVRVEDLGVLDEAFGARPEALAAHPFVAFYGPLNFYLANHPQATGGFSRAPLEQPPPLAGGPSRYPGILIQGLPPPQLTLTYPPHLAIVNHGYRLGWGWIREHPGAALGLGWKKLRRFWNGAALGLTGYNLPLGLSGVRRPVDLVVPEGIAAGAWRLVVLALMAVGLWMGRQAWPMLMPWVALLASKGAVTVAFYGYARQGATVIPVVALLAALAVERFLPGGPRLAAPSPSVARRWLLGAAVAAVLLLGIEACRWAAGPELVLDGRTLAAVDPFPVDEYATRRLEVR